jgi:hypothetical protein
MEKGGLKAKRARGQRDRKVFSAHFGNQGKILLMKGNKGDQNEKKCRRGNAGYVVVRVPGLLRKQVDKNS